jgi:hypothetical protein
LYVLFIYCILNTTFKRPYQSSLYIAHHTVSIIVITYTILIPLVAHRPPRRPSTSVHWLSMPLNITCSSADSICRGFWRFVTYSPSAESIWRYQHLTSTNFASMTHPDILGGTVCGSPDSSCSGRLMQRQPKDMDQVKQVGSWYQARSACLLVDAWVIRLGEVIARWQNDHTPAVGGAHSSEGHGPRSSLPWGVSHRIVSFK